MATIRLGGMMLKQNTASLPSFCRSFTTTSSSTHEPVKDAFGLPKTKRLNSGYDIPVHGLGLYRASDFRVTKSNIMAAINNGYRYLDTAFIFANEGDVGAAVKDTGVNREELFVCSKLWNTDHSPARIEKMITRSLSTLGFQYLDLYTIQWPVCWKPGVIRVKFYHNKKPCGDLYPRDIHSGDLLYEEVPLIDTWRSLEKLVKDGLVRSIGVANFSIKQLKEILSFCEIKPSVNQVEMQPYFQQNEMLDFCNENGIVITAQCPVGNPALVQLYNNPNLANLPARTRNPPPPPPPPAHIIPKAILLEDPVIKDIAQSMRKTPAQILIRWGMQRGTVVTVKSGAQHRIVENSRVWDFCLSEDQMQKINALGVKNQRVQVPEWWDFTKEQ